MKRKSSISTIARVGAVAALVFGTTATVATGTEPCDDFGECKVLIEINAADGDIGFHFLMDGDDLLAARLVDPNGDRVFEDLADGPLAEQFMTEMFVESAEPLCWEDPEAAPSEEEIVTLEEFLEIWEDGTYRALGKGEEDGIAEGETELTYEIPAAPTELDFDGSVITWEAGDDLGNCATNAELAALVTAGILPIHPEEVEVDAWEVVLEPDVEDGDPLGALVYSIRLPGDIGANGPMSTMEVSVPAEYLASLPDDTPVKIEVGGIGGEDNATFWEEDGFCVNEVEGCEEEE